MRHLSGVSNVKPYSKSTRGNFSDRSLVKAYQPSAKRQKLIRDANICAKLVTIRPDGGRDGRPPVSLLFTILADSLTNSYCFDSHQISNHWKEPGFMVFIC